MNASELKPGLHVTGVIPGQVVELIQVLPTGGAFNVFFQKLDGSLDSVTLFEDDILRLEYGADGDARSFKADPNGFLLAAEALRIQYSYVFDTRLAMHTSIIEPLPHQITAVYEDMLPRQPLRFLLADDPGAGKTIMAGLLIKELMIRGEVERCLIVCPGGLVQQWVEDELGPKFGLEFRMLTNDVIDSTKSGNPFLDLPLVVASMDKLARDERVQAMLRESEWDLVIVDESHKMSAHVLGRKVSYTRRYHLGELLSSRTRNLLLMTATPHNGKEDDFQEFMKLLDRDRFEGGARAGVERDIGDLMRRLQKEELKTFEGKPLFPIREARTAAYRLSPAEAQLYEDVTAYVREGFNLALRIVSKDKRNAVGFALTSLQRRLASSPMACQRSIARRLKRLQESVEEVREHGIYTLKSTPYKVDGWEWDEWDSDDQEDQQDSQEGMVILDSATAAETIEQLEEEIRHLTSLNNEAKQVLADRRDVKWIRLLELMDSPQIKDAGGKREKLIIFTEYTDTLEYLEAKLSSYLGSHDRLRAIRGGMNRDQRRSVEADFRQNDDVSVLIATDAAGEGINLQTAHILINYDLPWNPNRIEQRFGRIHRIGQKHTCYMYNLVAEGTREGDVWRRLIDKLEQENETLGGKVFDVLGQVTYDDKSLSDLLLESILEDETPERQAYLDTVIGDALDQERLRDIMARDVLATDTLDTSDITRVRAEIERANAMRLQPHYIQSFFVRALEDLGGRIVSNRDGTYRIRRVPLALAVKSSNGAKRPLSESYASLAFEKNHVLDPGKTDLVCVGHPLLDAAVEEMLYTHGVSLTDGAILVDSGNRTLGPRLMMVYSLSVCDGDGRDVQRRLYYVESEGLSVPVVFRKAPYIDYRPPTEEETRLYDEDLVWDCLGSAEDIERDAEALVMERLVAVDAKSIAAERGERLDRISDAVQKRLSHAIIAAARDEQKWTQRVRQGDENARLTASNKRRELGKLRRRMEVRMAEIKSQRNIRPRPLQLVACALVVPALMLDDTVDGREEAASFEARKASEERGMKAVTTIEWWLGNVPEDVSRENYGWDIQSTVPATDDVPQHSRYIESKGVKADADEVTLTPNEVMQAAGNRDLFWLAITRPMGDHTETMYLHGAIHDDYNRALSKFPFKIAELVSRADEVAIYEVKDGKCTRRS